MVRNVKKIIIPLFITVIALISVTFATSSNFNIDKIDFFNNSKMSKIYEKLEEEYRIKEPTLLATKNETEIINVSVQAISVLFGSPNQTIDNGYFTFTSKVETFAEYGYDNSDLPKDKNGNVQGDVQRLSWCCFRSAIERDAGYQRINFKDAIQQGKDMVTEQD